MKKLAIPFIPDTSPIALADKVVSDAYKAADTALDTRVKALETAVTGVNFTNNDYFLDGGALYTATEDIGLLSFVHRLPGQKIELATDSDPNKPADGIILSSVAVNGTTKVLGTGGRLPDIGLVGISAGARIYLGSQGNKSTSSSGSGRFIQEVAVFSGNFYRMDFRDSGYYIAP